MQQDTVILDESKFGRSGYFETQIWGRLTLDDVDQIVLPRGYILSYMDVKDTLKLLKKTGIPVYLEKPSKEMTELEKKMTDFRVSSVRGKIAIKGDNAKRRQFMKSNCRLLLK